MTKLRNPSLQKLARPRCKQRTDIFAQLDNDQTSAMLSVVRKEGFGISTFPLDTIDEFLKRTELSQ